MGPYYREHPVEPPLDDLVDCVWCLRGRSVAHDADVQRIPPDGSVELIFHLDDAFRQVDRMRSMRQPAAMIVGVWTGPIGLAAPVSYDTLGVRIRPGCLAAFFDVPARELTDVVVDAGAILGRSGSDLMERLRNMGDDATRVREVCDFLRRRRRHRERTVSRAVSRIVATGGLVAIDALARDAGVGHRWLERAFDAHVGVSPKMLSRIVRFQRVLRHPRTNGWAEVAIDCGYADQSHLIRDFTQFAGETPRSLVESRAAVADYFRRR